MPADKPKYDSPFSDALKTERALERVDLTLTILQEQFFLIEQDNLSHMNATLEEMKGCHSIDQMEAVIQSRTERLTAQIQAHEACVKLLTDRPHSRLVLETQLQGLIDQRALYFKVRENILNKIAEGENVRPIEFLESVQALVDEREHQFNSTPYVLNKKNHLAN